MQKFIDVILPLPLAGSYTYAVTDPEIPLEEGFRVVVPFGKKFYTGIVLRVHQQYPSGIQTKPLLAVLDDKPVVTRQQLRFWQWMATYYLCTTGDVYKAAFPSGLRIESETSVMYNMDFDPETNLTEKESMLLELLETHDEMKIAELQKESGIKNLLPLLRSLIEKGAIIVSEELKEGFQQKTEQYIALAATYRDESSMKELFDTLGRAPRQLSLLMGYISCSGYFSSAEPKEVSRKELLQKVNGSSSILRTLVNKGVFELYKKEIPRLESLEAEEQQALSLNEIQQEALQSIHSAFKEKEVVLLHGVTSSGKTEIYIHLMQEYLRKGKQVLYLLPEIALTTQITERLLRVFGSDLAVYHSKFSDNERVEIWNNLLHQKGSRVIVGVRSSLFLPFTNLGLIIVDEEHETSYKQNDPAPRYHARNAAIMLAHQLQAKVLLGTATPSLETYHNVKNGKYGLVELFQRFQEIALPKITTVDMQEQRRKKMARGIFSEPLLDGIKEALTHKEQVILFQNRRGFAPMVECPSCSWVPKCDHCDVSLTYHKGINQLVCHYCGSVYPVPRSCPSCDNKTLSYKGYGTEKIEDDIQLLFPDARLGRMDTDTTRSRKSYQKILSDFENGEIDILIGTQMISKGLDFDNVSIVGVVNADQLLNYPDFRAHERAFQLMAQVSGRAGRKNKQGNVIVQTNQPNHQIIGQVRNNDYSGMYLAQMEDRKKFNYPPFCRMVNVYIKNKDRELSMTQAEVVAQKLRAVFGARILGPDQPPVGRVQTYYIQKIVIKIEPEASLEKIRLYLGRTIDELRREQGFKSFVVYYDVDPM
ncbi:MAG: primosomal protein N' [Bacteroidales bacterium]|nr:primosomal protein N' [Bacteroidales bacterium]